MPYQVTVAVEHGGQSYAVGSVVPDALGYAMLAEHPNSLVRIVHDDDLCSQECAHEDHEWNAAPSPAPPAPRRSAPSSSSDAAAPSAASGV